MLEVSRSVTKLAVAVLLDQRGIAKQVEQRIGRALDLEQLAVGDACHGRRRCRREGLATTDGSGSNGRRPGFSSRVKQSCRLLKWSFFASDRSRSENSFQQRDGDVPHQRVLDLGEPAHEAGQRGAGNAVGQQEVEVFLLGERGDEGF